MHKRARIIYGGVGENLVATLPRATVSQEAAWLNPVPPRAVRDAFAAPPPPEPDPSLAIEQARLAELARLDAERKALANERAQVRELQARYAARLAEVANDVHAETRPTAEAVVELALAVARELVGREVKLDPQLLGAAIEDGMRQLDGEQPLQVRVSPVDIEAVRALPQFAGAKVDLIADQRLEPGGCTIESARSVIDRSLGRRVDAVRVAVLDLLEGRTPANGDAADDGDDVEAA